MRTKMINRIALSSFAAVMMVTGIFVTTANAQGGRRHGARIVIVPNPNPFWHRRFDRFDRFNRFDRWDGLRRDYYRKHQAQEGFKEGLEQGENDAEKGRRFNPRDQREYFKATSHTFRRAFVRGYYLGYRNEISDDRDDN